MDLFLLSWNVGGSPVLGQVGAEPVDLALLQEVPVRPSESPRPLPGRVTVRSRLTAWASTVADRDPARLRSCFLQGIPTAELCGPDNTHTPIARQSIARQREACPFPEARGERSVTQVFAPGHRSRCRTMGG